MAITEITRRAIFDELTLGPDWWCGKLDEPGFLARIYPMGDLPSHDARFSNVFDDVVQHCVNNDDWGAGWVFDDPRFGLSAGPDELLLRFLAETLHPLVRNEDDARRLAESYNRHLRRDGFELHQTGDISGRPIYGARSILSGAPASAQLTAVVKVDATYLSQQITRMESSIIPDPSLAIGTAKELVESVAKTILTARRIEFGKREDLPRLVRSALASLDLSREDIPDTARGADSIRRILSNLATIVDGVAELRNLYGTGHGRGADATGGIGSRHARLVVGAASTLASFLLETHEARPPDT